MKHTLHVSAKSGVYPVQIGPGLRHQFGELLAELSPRQTDAFIVTDTNVASCGYLKDIEAALSGKGIRTAHATLPPGDATKSLTQCESLYRALLAANIRRDGLIIALGGGVIGDLAGFAAATYLRGIRYIHAPTTLLAHDSSIGGKVGVNLDAGKNLVGAFYPPMAVIYDTDCLTSLPDREWRNGMAEVIKHGLIGDSSLFAALSAQPVPACPGSVETADLVGRAARVKIDIVARDEHETSLRMVLNVGHTIGHAVEKLSNYTLGHGEAVAIGLAAEALLAKRLGLLADETEAAITATLKQHGLPTQLPPYPAAEILRLINIDKKHAATGWTFALPHEIGDIRIVQGVNPEEVAACLGASS